MEGSSSKKTSPLVVYTVAAIGALIAIEVIRRASSSKPGTPALDSRNGLWGYLPPHVQEKASALIHASNSPEQLTQLANGLANAGAHGAANVAVQKADAIATSNTALATALSTPVPVTSPATAPVPATVASVAQQALDTASQVISAVTKPSHGTIRQGSTGIDVKAWQAFLGVSADGQFGPQTALATKAWQAAHGLTADGIVGPQTWTKAGV